MFSLYRRSKNWYLERQMEYAGWQWFAVRLSAGWTVCNHVCGDLPASPDATGREARARAEALNRQQLETRGWRDA